MRCLNHTIAAFDGTTMGCDKPSVEGEHEGGCHFTKPTLCLECGVKGGGRHGQGPPNPVHVAQVAYEHTGRMPEKLKELRRSTH